MKHLFAAAMLALGSDARAAFVAAPPQNVSNDAADSIQPCVAHGPDGNAHVVWVSGSTTREVRYARGVWNGSNHVFGASRLIASVGSFGYSTPNLIVTSNNVLALCWSDGATLWVRTWPATNSVPGGTAAGIGAGIAAALATDSSNRFHIVWSGDFDVRYCLWNGAACERSEIIGVNNALRPDLAVDRSNNVHVVWDGGGIWYRNRAANGNWNSAVALDGGGNNCQIATDQRGEVHIAWSRDFDIQYLRRTFTVSSLETRTFNSGSDLEPSVGATPAGRLLLAFRDATAGRLRYVTRENGVWTALRDLMNGVPVDVSARGYFERVSAVASHDYDIQLLTVNGETSGETLVPQGAPWKFRDTGTDPGTAWRGTNFNDAAWASGFAPLGFGDGDEATVVNGGSSTNRHMAIYFRHTFTLTNAPLWTNLQVRLWRDDGAVVYLNGTEVFRSNMPTGAMAHATAALTNVNGTDESTGFYSASVNAPLLLNGTNVVAVEVHQNNNQSSDLTFDLEMRGVLRPVLKAAVVGNQLRLNWTAPVSNYVLQSAALHANPAWSNVSNAVIFTNGAFESSLPATGTARWFRLAR